MKILVCFAEVIRWYKNPNWWLVLISALGVASTLLLGLLAVFGKEVFIKLKFSYQISKIDQRVDGEIYQIFRIKIKNLSRRPAKNMLVSVVKIYDKKNGKYHKREDFIHMPLEWTHFPMENKVRNISAQEEVYVDIGQYDLFNPGLKLYTNPRTDAKQLYAVLEDAKLILRVVEQNGFTEEVTLNFKIEVTGGDLVIGKILRINRG